MRTLVYTICNTPYERFIPPFVLSNIYFNNDVDVEIGVSKHILSENTEKMLNIIKNAFPDNKVKIDYNAFTEINNTFAQIHDRKVRYGTLRWITQPTLKDEYVYIGDIDIITLEAFTKWHIDKMKSWDGDYDNIIRSNNAQKMSGLHFAKYNSFYPIDTKYVTNWEINNEIILKQLVSAKTAINETLTERPVHGFHLSPNRKMLNENGKPSWGLGKKNPTWELDEKFKQPFVELVNSKIYKDIYNLLDEKMKNDINNVRIYFNI